MRTYVFDKILKNGVLNFVKAKPKPAKPPLVNRLSSRFAQVTAFVLMGSMVTASVVQALQHEERVQEQRFAQEARCLSLTLFWEGKRSNVEDQAAIAQNIVERTVSGQHPTTICGVTNEIRLAKTSGRPTAMYSYIFDGRADPAIFSGKDWEVSQRIAKFVMQDWADNKRNFSYFAETRRLVSYSINYHAEMKVWPTWAYEDVKSCRFKPLGKIAGHYHYADFRRADPEGYRACLAAKKQPQRIAKR